MKSFVLIDFTYCAHLVHVYGVIEAKNANDAAASIGSQIESQEVIQDQSESIRYRLKESKSGFNHLFLEELRTLTIRPLRMNERN